MSIWHKSRAHSRRSRWACCLRYLSSVLLPAQPNQSQARRCQAGGPPEFENQGSAALSIFRKAFSVACVVLMFQFFAQLYLVAAAVLTIFQADDNAEDVYSAFKSADTFAGLHRANGDLIALTILVMIGCSFGARYPWRTTILTAVLFLLLIIQSILAYTGIPALSGLHGVNALVMIGLSGYLIGRHWAFRTGSAATAPSS